MTDFLRGRLRAAEGSYFKKEQEEDLRLHRKKLVKGGKLELVQLPPTALSPEGSAAAAAAHTPEKLAEIYAQEVRLTAPDEATRRRVASLMPPMEGRGTVRPRWSMVSGDMAPPRGSLGRQAWSMEGAREELRAAIPEETEAMRQRREVARRALAAGTRALLYGSAAAVVGAVVGGRVVAHVYGIHTIDDVRATVQGWLGPAAGRVQLSMAPVKARLEAMAGGGGRVCPASARAVEGERGERRAPAPRRRLLSAAGDGGFRDRLKQHRYFRGLSLSGSSGGGDAGGGGGGGGDGGGGAEPRSGGTT